MDQRGSVLMRLDFVEIAQFLITRRSVSSGNSPIGHSGRSVIGLILRGGKHGIGKGCNWKGSADGAKAWQHKVSIVRQRAKKRGDFFRNLRAASWLAAFTITAAPMARGRIQRGADGVSHGFTPCIATCVRYATIMLRTMFGTSCSGTARRRPVTDRIHCAASVSATARAS
jgi:hypothetical protein